MAKRLSSQAASSYARAFKPYRDDFPKFCGLLEIRTKSQGVVRFSSDRWHPEQWAFERARTGNDIVLKPRQIGFSTLELARDTFYALKHEGVQVLIIGQSKPEVQALFATVKLFVEGCAEAGLCAAKQKYDNKNEIVFAHNGSAIRVKEAGVTAQTAEKKARSGTIHRLHLTEVAFYGAAEATLTAALDAVPKNGEIVVESTANGVGGAFYRAVMDAKRDKGVRKFHFFPWFHHPSYEADPSPAFGPPEKKSEEERWEAKLLELGADERQIAWWRRKVRDSLRGGLEKALQEHPITPESAFRSPSGRYIKAEACDRLDRGTRSPLRHHPLIWRGKRGQRDFRDLGVARIFAEPIRGRSYIAGEDLSEGTGNDGHAIAVIDANTAETVATWAKDDIEAGDAGLALALLGELYNFALAAPERNNHGHAAIRALREEAEYPNIYVHSDDKLGFPTTPVTRPVLFDELRSGIETELYCTPDAETAAECRTIVKDHRGRPAAMNKGKKDGCSDDRVIAWGIALQARHVPQPHRGGSLSVSIPGLTN